MGRGSAVLVALGFTLLVCSALVSAETHVVGDSKGWGFSVSYDSWSGGKTFAAGDMLGTTLSLSIHIYLQNDANRYLLLNKNNRIFRQKNTPLSTHKSNFI